MTDEKTKYKDALNAITCGMLDTYDLEPWIPTIAEALEDKIEAEKKPKRRIDTMTEEELTDFMIYKWEDNGGKCDGCPVFPHCKDSFNCHEILAHYLLSPVEKKMTHEEAHEILENQQREMTKNRHLYSKELIDANGEAILALEKQIEAKKKLIELKENLRAIKENGDNDIEENHVNSDEFLLDFIGDAEIAELFHNIRKWYF